MFSKPLFIKMAFMERSVDWNNFSFPIIANTDTALFHLKTTINFLHNIQKKWDRNIH